MYQSVDLISKNEREMDTIVRTTRTSHRRDTLIDENALQHLLLNESVWKHAFSHRRRASNSKCASLVFYLQFVYEKSQMFIPIVLLLAYSVLGGLMFWNIERWSEEELLEKKRDFMDDLKDSIVDVVLQIQQRLFHIQTAYQNNTYVGNVQLRGYKRFALNAIHKRVYWYTLSAFYLTEHETNKALALKSAKTMRNCENNFERIHTLKNYTEQLSQRLWEIAIEGAAHSWDNERVKGVVNDAISEFSRLSGLDHVLTPIWTFWNSMFLAVTTYTTIGYGNITAKTTMGQFAAMVYAVIGIPLVLMILHKLGRFFLVLLERIWNFIVRAAEYACVLPQLSNDERTNEMPLLLAIGVAFGWMFLCAAIFIRFEDWGYFKSFYYVFTTLTTIGYGDVTPTNSEDMFIIFGLIMIGLSLVSMCINVIQLKLEKLFEELLLTMMEEYSSDPDSSRFRAGKIGIMEMWRVWKKRKGRLRKRLAPAREVAEKASENLAKLALPFSRRRGRRELIEKLRQTMRMKHKATQTEWGDSYNIYDDVDSYTTSDTAAHIIAIPNASICAPSRCESRPVRALPEPSICSTSSLMPTSASIATQPLSVESETSQLSSLSTVSSHHTTHSQPFSVVSAPPHPMPIDFDPNRRWTFIATGRAPRGTPRGLAVPTYMHRVVKEVHTTEVSRLIAELDARLEHCRVIVKSHPSNSSNASNASSKK